MKRLLSTVILVAILAVPVLAFAKKTTYISTNHRLNYVKLVEVGQTVAEERQMSHPTEIPDYKMREILASIRLSKQHMIGESVDEANVYNDAALNFLAPALSQAFRAAKSNEEVQFSYVVKDPKFILRNDRITMVTAWVSGNQLFFQFDKLFAKLTGDTDKRGDMSKIVSRARGLRVSLELKPGQSMAAVGSDVMSIDLDTSYTAAPATSVAEAEEGASTAPSRPQKSKYSRSKTGEAATGDAAAETSAAAAAAPAGSDVERRLEELDTLRKRNLISRKDYEAKKKEILNDL